jgi:adenylosuccinate synthase
MIAEKGGEFGTTTGRPRRCGWLDLVVTGYANSLSGLNGIALTKIDVLGGIGDLKVCTHYGVDGKRVLRIPADLKKLERCEPKYATLKGWDEIDVPEMKRILSRGFTALPENMKKYVRFLEYRMKVPVVLLGLGRRRNEILDLRKSKWKTRRK